MGFLTLVYVYILGGLTFIPLFLLAILAHAYYTLPEVDATSSRSQRNDVLNTTASGPVDLSKLPKELQKADRERDAAAGYFAISREYVQGGVNGKPPERLTPAGEVIALESPSVYQSMYRSIFARDKTTGPAFEADKSGAGGGAVKTKKARNVFYVVLRLGHLMLYDNAEQIEVRHVISLGLYEVDVYGGEGEGEIPEGELWVKRNCIRLKRREKDYTLRGGSDSKPYYLFSDNCSDKEDFYHALVQNQHRSSNSDLPPVVPLKFEAEHMVKLVQQLHGSEELMQTRWFNALLGRVFLSLYKTSEVHEFLHKKIMKKIARIQTPSFIEEIKVGRIDMGSAAPLFTNQKLRELTLDGELVLETDVRYSGNFRLEIAAQVLIDLGKRFNVRRIDVLLSGLLKSLEGRLLIKIKPPPCNRIWISFETMPKLDLSIEPIVSSRQITYGIILRTIESKIREVMGETLVYPNWDDIPFSHSEGDSVRGGLWDFHGAGWKPPNAKSEDEKEDEELLTPAETALKSQSTPSLLRRRPVGTAVAGNGKVKSSKTFADTTSLSSSGRDSPASSSKPKAIRSNSFASTSPPQVSMSPTHANAFKQVSEEGQGPSSSSLEDAVSTMKGLSSRTSSTSSTPLPLDLAPASAEKTDDTATEDRKESMDEQDVFDLEMPPADETPRSASASTAATTTMGHARNSSKSSLNIEGFGTPDPAALPNSKTLPGNKTKAFVANAQVAALAAKKWGLDFAAKRAATLPTKNEAATGSEPELSSTASVQSMPLPAPMGRGQPLPPPGQPLPGPRKSWANAIGSIGRKKAPQHTPSVSSLTSEGRDAALKAASLANASGEHLPPLPPRRSTEVEGAGVPGSPAIAGVMRHGNGNGNGNVSRKSVGSASQHSRRSSRVSRGSVDGAGAGAVSRTGSDEVLVIKAPSLDDSEASSTDAEKRSSEDKDATLREEGIAGEDEQFMHSPAAASTPSITPPSEGERAGVGEPQDKTPTQPKSGDNELAVKREEEIQESVQTRDSDRDSLEMLQALVY